MCKETSFSRGNLEIYLNTISFSKLTEEKTKTLDGGITEKELHIALQCMENNKSPGNYGLTKEFYVTFQNEVKIPLPMATKKPVKYFNTTQCIVKTSSNEINRKERTRQKVYSKLATYFLT